MTRESPFCKRDEIADSLTHLSRAFLARALFWRFSITASSVLSVSLSAGQYPHAPRPTIVGVRRRCRAPSWFQHSPRGRGQHATKSYVQVRARKRLIVTLSCSV